MSRTFKLHIYGLSKAKFGSDEPSYFNQIVGTARSMAVYVGEENVQIVKLGEKKKEDAPAAAPAPEAAVAPAPAGKTPPPAPKKEEKKRKIRKGR